MIDVRDLTKHYAAAAGLRSLLPGRGREVTRAVEGVSFAIGAGEVLGLVGESGSGKSTTGRLLVGLETPTSGSMRIDGTDSAAARACDKKGFHRQVQMIFQDPYGALNPQHVVEDLVGRPLLYQGVRDRSAIAKSVRAVLAEVGLTPVENYLGKHPHQLSGGQRQRVCIARAIILEPRFLVADEPVSMLDVSIKWDIVRLLKRLARQRGIAMLYITHDLATVGAVCDRLAIMYRGRIVETGPVEQVMAAPVDPYTRTLIAAIPSADPDLVRAPRPVLVQGLG